MTTPGRYARNWRLTRGRCHPCALSYVWPGLPRLRDAICTTCGGKLSVWYPHYRGAVRDEKPAVSPERVAS